jgi:threonylcarbamoyladenosine tRNA methylthiotransferase MtaB
MNRKYTISQYKKAVKAVSENIPGCGITTDIIVGFPGETREQFEETVDLVRNSEFLKVHIFKFSTRKGTAAWKMEPKVPSDIKKERAALLDEAASQASAGYLKHFIGNAVEVLVEEEAPSKPGWHIGHSSEYIKVIFPSEGVPVRPNDMFPVKIVEIKDNFLVGSLQQ